MRLIIQIPCFNEAETLPVTLSNLPDRIDGIDEIRVLVIDDGSTDGTAEAARKAGADHVLVLPENRGLAYAFRAGLDEAVRLGADIILNTDADNQYRGQDVPRLVEPILAGRAEMVIGTRDIDAIAEFSASKKMLQRLGSRVVRMVSGTRVSDATSGFRAFSREAALRLNVFSSFSYTLETIIQAGKCNISMAFVPVGTNPKLRESRLYSSTASYLTNSIQTILRIYTLYEPLKAFTLIGLVPVLLGSLIGVRFLYYFFTSGSQGHVQSLILASILIILGFLTIVFGLLADLNGANRRLIEDALFRMRKLELEQGTKDGNNAPSRKDEGTGAL